MTERGQRLPHSGWENSNCGRHWRGGFGFFRGTLDVGGAFPSGEFVGVAAVFVLHDGVEAGDDVLGVAEEGVDSGGVFDAFEVVADFSAVDVAEGLEVGAEVLDEVGGNLEGDELGLEVGVFRDFEKF